VEADWEEPSVLLGLVDRTRIAFVTSWVQVWEAAQMVKVPEEHFELECLSAQAGALCPELVVETFVPEQAAPVAQHLDVAASPVALSDHG
jgi:hypothetical protein